MDLEPWLIVVLLGIAALLYAFMLPKRSKEEGTAVVKEVEATLEQYMADIEKENDQLIDLIAQLKQEWSAKQLGLQEQVSELRERLVKVEQQNHRLLEERASLNEQDNQRSILIAADSQAEELIEPSQKAAQTEAAVIDSRNASPELTESYEEPSNSIMERYSELFELYHQGKSIDTIGKAIGMHRGEVQLILQLAKQEGLKG